MHAALTRRGEAGYHRCQSNLVPGRGKETVGKEAGHQGNKGIPTVHLFVGQYIKRCNRMYGFRELVFSVHSDKQARVLQKVVIWSPFLSEPATPPAKLF